MHPAWDGLRSFRVTAKHPECANTWSLHLAPVDGAALPRFRPGQYLTFELPVPGAPGGRPLVRCYSLSDRPRPERYRVTVKRLLPRGGSPGQASSWIAQEVRVGMTLQSRAPMGSFTIDPGAAGPLVLIAGGVGITPMMSMLEALDEVGIERETWLFFGVRNRREHPFRERLEALSDRHDWLRLRVAYSQPGTGRLPGVRHGRVTPELLRRELPPADVPYAFYVCGPTTMNETIRAGLLELGVPESQVHLEAFGAPSVRPMTRRLSKRLASGAEVTFSRSGTTVPWQGDAGSILDLAMDNGVFFPFACAAGHCGTCASKLVSGEVEYPFPPQFAVREGYCLPCIATPSGPVVIEQ